MAPLPIADSRDSNQQREHSKNDRCRVAALILFCTCPGGRVSARREALRLGHSFEERFIPRPCHRLFFALQPPEPQGDAIEAISRLFPNQGSPVRRDRRHLTMLITDDYRHYPAMLESALISVGDSVSPPPVNVALRELVGTETSVSLRPKGPAEALIELHRALACEALVRSIPLRRDWWFYPHMTLLYRDGRRFTKSLDPIVWRADELVLIHSHVGRTRHRILKRWPLGLSGSATIH